VAISDLTIDLDGATLSVGVSGLKVADGGVDNTQLAADAVDGTKLADDSVDSEHIAAGAIDNEHFAAGSVSGSALANAGVGSAKIAELDNFDTDALSEGSTNRYYADSLARAAVSVTDSGGDGSMAYDSGTGVFTYTGPSASEVRAHFSAGDAIAISSGQISVDSSIAGHGLNVSSGVLSAQHSVKSIGITNATASYGMNFQSGGTISSTVSVRLPAIVSGTVGVAGDLGKVVMVKAAELSGSGKVTVACAGSSTIDGPTDASLDIESSAGAVTLMVVSQDGNGIWAII